MQLVGDDLFVTNVERLRARHRRRDGQRDPHQAEPDRHAHRDARLHPPRRRERLPVASSATARARPRTRSSPTSPSPPTRGRSRRAACRAPIAWPSTTSSCASASSSARARSTRAQPVHAGLAPSVRRRGTQSPGLGVARRRGQVASASLFAGRQALFLESNMAKSKVAVLKVKPETILEDIERLCELGGMKQALAQGPHDHPQGQHLLALPVPRREHDALADGGHHPGAQARRLHRHHVRAEQDGRDQRLQGRGPEPLRPALQASTTIPVLYNFKDDRHEVGRVPAQGEDARPSPHLPRGDPDPRLLLRQEHRPPADGEVPHLHDDDRRDEERLRRAARDQAALHALVDPPDARRSPRHPEGDPHGPLRGDGRHDGRQRPRAAHDDPGRQGLHARERRPGGHRRRRRQDDGLRPDEARVHQGRPRRRARRGRPARHRDRRRRHLRRELGLPRWATTGASHVGRLAVVRPAEELPEALLPHAARERVHLRAARPTTTTTAGR